MKTATELLAAWSAKGIKSKDDAIEYLTDLHNNGFEYHCDDDAKEIGHRIGTTWVALFAPGEAKIANALMDKVHEFHPDPCEVLLDLDQ